MKSEELRGFVRGWAKLGFLCLAFCAAVVGFAAESINITATPRYPWNGKVDLKFTIDGTSGTKYDTSFTAKDVAGGTNLTMKTLTKSDGTAANVAKEQLLPGTYNWVWDATADLTSRWSSYASCVPTSSTVLFKNTQLAAIEDFYAVPCGTAVNDKSNRVKGRWIKTDGAGKSVQFAFSDDKYTKCVCVHFEQLGADVVGCAKWARYVSGLGHENEDFDTNSATTQTIATSETATGYGLHKLEARIPQPNPSVVLDRVVVEGEVKTPVYYVKFNANGGSGTMANEEFEVGVAKALTANAFTRTGYSFQGWATSASGAKVYSDKQSVSDLSTTAGATVNLYAVWSGRAYVVIDCSSGAVTYMDNAPSGGWANDPYKYTKIAFKRIPAGTFTQKSDSGNRQVTISKDYYISVYPATLGQLQKIGGDWYGNSVYDTYMIPLVGSIVAHENALRWMRGDAKWPDEGHTASSTSVIGKLRTRSKFSLIDLPTEAQLTKARASISLGSTYNACLDYWRGSLGTAAVTDPVGCKESEATGERPYHVGISASSRKGMGGSNSDEVCVRFCINLQ